MLGEKTKQAAAFPLKSAFNQLIEGLLPLAIWRLPNQDSFQCAISRNPAINLHQIDLEVLDEGFVFAPFDYSESKKAIFIEADSSFDFTSFEDNAEQDFIELYDSINFTSIKEYNHSPFKFDLDENQQDKTVFVQNVTSGIKSIIHGDFEKVVLSRKKEIERTANFNPIVHFQHLADTYPTVFCSLTYLPWTNEIWIGATPESLVSQDENGIFRTMALAGTQAGSHQNGEDILTADALWRQKEIEEQALVSRYIINCFKKIRVREFTEIGPKSVRAGNLIHLQTAFEVNTNEIELPQLGSIMIDLLHPTSAICGMPQKPALAFLKETENYDRSYYSGFLGPINIKNSTNLFVNLRTLRATKDKITLYAGCGITKDSNPEKEWAETQIKLKTVAV